MEKVWAKVNGNYEMTDASNLYGDVVESLDFLLGVPIKYYQVQQYYYYDYSNSAESIKSQPMGSRFEKAHNTEDKMAYSSQSYYPYGSNDITEVISNAYENGFPMVAVYSDYSNNTGMYQQINIPILGIYNINNEWGYEMDTVIFMDNPSGADLPFYSWNDDNEWTWNAQTIA